jgi:diguanylate cyclase (GGDEF)-like protein
MLDIDNFTVYNDTYGHPQGDVLLLALAEVLTKTLNRPTDFSSRWGGEEFMVLLPDTSIDGTLKIAENIRENVENTMVLCADGIITSTTVSLGAVSKVPDDEDSSAEFIAEADKLLYSAKKNGKNQVCGQLSAPDSQDVYNLDARN